MNGWETQGSSDELMSWRQIWQKLRDALRIPRHGRNSGGVVPVAPEVRWPRNVWVHSPEDCTTSQCIVPLATEPQVVYGPSAEWWRRSRGVSHSELESRLKEWASSSSKIELAEAPSLTSSRQTVRKLPGSDGNTDELPSWTKIKSALPHCVCPPGNQEINVARRREQGTPALGDYHLAPDKEIHMWNGAVWVIFE